MNSFEAVRTKIKANFPKSDKPSTLLRWAPETSTSIVTTCYRYRINRYEDEETKARTYTLDLTATSVRAGKRIDGPFDSPDKAKAAAQAHFAQGVLKI